MKQKLLLLGVMSLSLLSSYSFAHPNHAQTDSDINWGNGPGASAENHSSRYNASESSRSESINWGNGPGAARSNLDSTKPSFGSSGSDINWGNGPGL